VHFTLRNVLELSKNIVTSIQQNLREFSERNQDAVMPDSILDHRRPKSGQMGSGAAAGIMGAGGMGMGMGALNPAYFEEDEGDNIFDPEDYAFMRREKRRGGAGAGGSGGGGGGGAGEAKRSGSPVKAGAGGGGYSTAGNDADTHEVVSCSSPSKTAGAGAANSGSHGTGTGTGWPTKRTVLHSMEFIIGGLLFVSDYTWIPQKMLTEVVAHHFINK
jgi:hypothetical protein